MLIGSGVLGFVMEMDFEGCPLAISAILSTLKPAMSTPAIYWCPDGHFCQVIFSIGPFIVDYPEQVMLAGIKQGWCPW